MNHYVACGHETGIGVGASYGFTNGEYLYEVDAGYCYCFYDGDTCTSEFRSPRVALSWAQGDTARNWKACMTISIPERMSTGLILQEPFENTANPN